MQKLDKKIKNIEKIGGQQWYILLPNGRTYPKILLNIADEKQREKLVADTFLKFYEHKYKTKLPKAITERDSPHDFTFSGNKNSLKIEIAGIEDSKESIKQQRQQKHIESKISNLVESFLIFLPKNTSNKDIQNISEQARSAPFGNIEDNVFIASIFQKGTAEVWKIAHDGKKRIFLTTTNTKNDLHELAIKAIRSKEKKNYPDIRDIVLILDDRSIKYDREHILSFLDPIIQYGETSPFKEIFIFSGRFITNDGGIAFTIYPIKALRDKVLIFFKYAAKHQGTYYGHILKAIFAIRGLLSKDIHHGKPHS